MSLIGSRNSGEKKFGEIGGIEPGPGDKIPGKITVLSTPNSTPSPLPSPTSPPSIINPLGRRPTIFFASGGIFVFSMLASLAAGDMTPLT